MGAKLGDICTSLYRTKSESVWIEQCKNDQSNLSLSTDEINQIEKKCSPISPLNAARACARDLGLSAPESGSVVISSPEPPPPSQPPIIYVEGESERDKCVKKCDNARLNDKISKDQYNECYETCMLGDDVLRLLKRDKEIEEKKKETITPWGRFALKLGLDVSQRYAEYQDVYKDWNTGYHTQSFQPMPSHDDAIDMGVQAGARIALTTEPSFTRWPNTNILFKGTLLDMTFFGEVDEVTDIKGADLKIKVADLELQIPFYKRSFLEVGTAEVNKDMVWLKTSNPFLIIPSNIHVGVNWQFRGVPITISNKVRDTIGMSYILSSYAMLGMSAEVAAVNLFHHEKECGFSLRATKGGCGMSSTDSQYFSYDHSMNNPESGVTMGGSNSVNTHVQLRLQPHIFGEERWNGGAFIYKSFADFYPTWQKLEVGGKASLHFDLGEAMELYLEGSARYLNSFKEDNEPLLPDRGWEWGLSAGLGFRPSAVF